MLSRRLVLYAGAAFFPLAALLAYGLFHDRQDSVQAARESLMRATRVLSARHRRLIERTENVAALLSELPGVRRGDVQLVNNVFAQMTRRYTEYPNLRLSGLDGRMVASARPEEPATNNAGRDWFEEVIRTSGSAMSRSFVGVTTARPVIVLGYPVLDDAGGLAFVLSVTLDLAGLAGPAQYDLPAGAVVTVLGRSGTVLARSDARRGQAVHAALVGAVRAGGREGLLDFRDTDGTPWVAGFVALPFASGSEGLSVAVEVPSHLLLAPVSRAVFLSGGGAFLVVALLFGAGTVGGRRLFVSPVRALQDVMSRLAHGELTARPSRSLLEDTSEFGELARSLKSVAEQFQARDTTQVAERERLQAVFDAFFGFATLLSPDGRIQEINSVPLALRGVHRDDVIGRSFTEAGAFGEEASVQIQAIIERAAAGETVQTEVGPIETGEGRHFLSTQFSPIRDGAGRIVNVVGFGIDITERRTAEEALRMRERELAAIYENSPNILFSAAIVEGERFRMASVNPAFLRVTGLTPEAVLGRFVEDVLPSPSLELLLARYRTAARSKQIVHWEETAEFPAGRRFGLVSLAPVIDSSGRCTHLVGSVYDNTQIRESQEALRASEERLRLALRAARQGFYDLDLDTGIAQVNDDYALMLGYDPATFEETHDRWVDRLHPDDRLRVLQEWDGYLRGDIPAYEVECRQHTASGEWKWILSIGAIAGRDAHGRPTRLIGTHLDISSRVQGAANLRASEARLREAQRLSRMGDWELDLASGRLLWSDELYRIFEVDPTQFGASYEGFLSAVHPDDRATVDEVYSTALRERRPYRLVHRILLPDGRIKHIEEQCETEYAPDGTPVRSRGTAQDITERMRTEGALRISEANLKRAEGLALLGHFEFNLGGTDPVWSEGLKGLFGFSPNSDPPAQAFADLIHPEDRPTVSRVMNDSLSDGEPFECDFRLVRPGGLTLFVRSRGEPVRNPSTGQLRLFGAVLDISVLKLAEQRLTELNESLEQRVADRTLELEATNRELEAFSYSVSHDLRAPLRAVDGFSLALLEDEAPRLSASGHADLGRIRAAAQRMGELIDSMLQLSRLLREPMDPELVDLSALASQVAADLTEARPAPRAEIAIEPGLLVRGDRRLLRAALANLLQNALKFSANVPEPRVEVGTCDVQGQPVIFVRDNGVGFDMAYAGKLFAPFERLHPPGEFPGTGIGLTTVHRIVARHGGRIWACSEPGKGATFFLELAPA